MKPIKNLVLASSFILIFAFTFNQYINWEITNDYSIRFSGTDVEGVFKKLAGDIQFDENDLGAAKCILKIDVSSINTGNGMKNKHAVSDKWFDAAIYPNIQFESNSFSKTEKGFQVTGIIEIHGIKKEMTIPFTFVKNVFKTNFSVNRLDFKVGTMKGMMKKVSNEIKLDISIPVIKK